jgi:hypothetical protein
MTAAVMRFHISGRPALPRSVTRRLRRREASVAGAADTWVGRPTEAPLRPDAWHPVHRHDVAVRELAIGGSSSTVAVATRQRRQRRVQPPGVLGWTEAVA